MNLIPLFGALFALATGIGYIFHGPAAPTAGATLPSATAAFETSLQSAITSSASSMTLTANSVRGGGSISGYNCFTVDEGSAQAETICGTVSGTSVTSLSRGISQSTGTTTVAALQFAHRRGANVKITDFPIVQILKAQANGEDTYANILSYASHPTFTATTQIIDKKYVDDTAFSGAAVIDATAAARGVVELATQTEAASSTSQGSSGVLAIPASIATSTWNSATAGTRVVVTQNNGKIDNNFIATSTLFSGTTTLAGLVVTATSSSIGAFPAWQIGKQVSVITTTGTSTFSVPVGITKLSVQVVGAGGGGGGSAVNTGGYGGAGGGCSWENVDVTGTSTIQVFVGSAGSGSSNAAGGSGTWSTFGTNGFYLSATGGGGGGTSSGSPGLGGIGSGGDLNTVGQGGGGGSAVTGIPGGIGGSSCIGGGGASGINTATNGGNYGGGGSGGHSNSGSSSGGSGAQGVVIVRW